MHEFIHASIHIYTHIQVIHVYVYIHTSFLIYHPCSSKWCWEVHVQ